jgi:hypothetical protein
MQKEIEEQLIESFDSWNSNPMNLKNKKIESTSHKYIGGEHFNWLKESLRNRSYSEEFNEFWTKFLKTLLAKGIAVVTEKSVACEYNEHVFKKLKDNKDRIFNIADRDERDLALRSLQEDIEDETMGFKEESIYQNCTSLMELKKKNNPS